ncbi:patatin-like phospholipase family protein [Vibrio campbellii]|uniref:patatin-like phospholipase family protein n=1 Tax=Vibrio campbellii TaxID=680 RepID=UPI001F305072|nr:patatin-like phospholipase family protein [Vibrio campbellii]MCE7733156.1 patatin-like phospholipase family protein [Vibrio campbellii]
MKKISLALQGGGSHGAFTWGVLDYLLSKDELELCSISGTSAGAMNATILAQGLQSGGKKEAREALKRFWDDVSTIAESSPIKTGVYERLMGSWNIDMTPGFIFFDLFSRLASPYQTNPLGYNPLKDIIERHIDFETINKCTSVNLFIAATNVRTGRVKVFERKDLTCEKLMASACIPTMFHAVEIEGEYYWDGGFSGNPPLFPFLTKQTCSDVLVVQINPQVRNKIPKSSSEINNRINEITFNQSLLKELKFIDFVDRLMDSNENARKKYKRLFLHSISDDINLPRLGASSKLNAEKDFISYLFKLGKKSANSWFEENYKNIGEKSSIDLRDMFLGTKL